MPEDVIDINTNKVIGKWTHACKPAQNVVTLTGWRFFAQGHGATGAKELADVAATLAKSAVSHLGLSKENQDDLNKDIDTVKGLAPGGSVTIEVGTFIDYRSPKCAKGTDPVAYVSYQVWDGVKITIAIKGGAGAADIVLEVRRDVASGHADCACDELAASEIGRSMDARQSEAALYASKAVMVARRRPAKMASKKTAKKRAGGRRPAAKG